MVESSYPFDPSEMSGVTRHLFRQLYRFRRVAIDNHLDGNLELISYHECNVVDDKYLLDSYDPPVVMTVPTAYNTTSTTITENTDKFRVDCAVFDWDWSRDYGVETCLMLIGNIINNVTSNPTMTKPDGSDPVSNDVTWSDVKPDFRYSTDSGASIYWASTQFEIESRRQTERGTNQ